MFMCYQGLDCYASLAMKLFQNCLKSVLGYTFVRQRCLQCLIGQRGNKSAACCVIS